MSESQKSDSNPNYADPATPPSLGFHPRKSRRQPGFWFFVLGFAFFLAAAGLSLYNVWQAHQAEEAITSALHDLPPKIQEAMEKTSGAPQGQRPAPDWPMPVAQVEGEEIIGVLEVPRTGLVLPILSTWDYDKLKHFPCYYHGSIYRKDAVFFSHDYPFQFGGLTELEEGDTARFIDCAGNIFTYRFQEQEYLQATDVEDMVFKDDWDLTLFTCAYNGLARYAYRFVEDNFFAP
ncbi:MAG: sortase [Eubacteriales bacterium]|nr:sortase [Clostridiales bacterium]MDY5835677.1 sortase [Eubacteriales bacterium]